MSYVTLTQGSTQKQGGGLGFPIFIQQSTQNNPSNDLLQIVSDVALNYIIYDIRNVYIAQIQGISYTSTQGPYTAQLHLAPYNIHYPSLIYVLVQTADSHLRFPQISPALQVFGGDVYKCVIAYRMAKPRGVLMNVDGQRLLVTSSTMPSIFLESSDTYLLTGGD